MYQHNRVPGRDLLKRDRREHRIPPYSGLARVYDRLVGNVLFPVIKESFERCINDLGLRFRAAADIGCGTGVFLHYLLRYRVPLVGVDASLQMLRIAARRLQGKGVRLLRQDIRRLRLPQPVDLITCNGDTLNYLLSTDDLAKTLRSCRANLVPGGHLVCDLLTGKPDGMEGDVPDLRIRLPGLVSLWSCRMYPDRRLTKVMIRSGHLTQKGWRWEREVHLQRWHSVPEVLMLLDQVNLELCALWQLGGEGQRGLESAWLKLVVRRE